MPGSCYDCYYCLPGWLLSSDSSDYTCRFSKDYPNNLGILAMFLIDTDEEGWEEKLKMLYCEHWRPSQSRIKED